MWKDRADRLAEIAQGGQLAVLKEMAGALEG